MNLSSLLELLPSRKEGTRYVTLSPDLFIISPIIDRQLRLCDPLHPYFRYSKEIDTAMTQTVSARLTQNGPQELPSSEFPQTFTPTVTFIPLDITATFTPTITPSPKPIFTNTPVVPLMSVSRTHQLPQWAWQSL